jgi:hypothetical protein
MTIASGGKPFEENGSGDRLTASMKAALAGCKAGSTVIFSNIVAVGPDGGERILGNIALKVE